MNKLWMRLWKFLSTHQRIYQERTYHYRYLVPSGWYIVKWGTIREGDKTLHCGGDEEGEPRWISDKDDIGFSVVGNEHGYHLCVIRRKWCKWL